MDRYFITPDNKRYELPQKPPKKVQFITKPYKKYNVQGLVDDFYTKVIDWHKNFVTYSISNHLCIFDFNTSRFFKIFSFKYKITSLRFFTDIVIAVGCENGELHLVNMNKICVQTYMPHHSRIGTIERYNQILFSGSQDCNICYLDTRCPKAISIGRHEQEVCGLKINNRGSQIASGGNDNRIGLYDLRSYKFLSIFAGHEGAVRAISWCPRTSSLLCTGGGTADRRIKIWDVKRICKKKEDYKNFCIKTVDCGAQICDLHWTTNNEIISNLGYIHNDTRIFIYPSMKISRIYKAHRNRVIHFSVSEDQEFFVTGSSDDKLCFWKLKEENFDDFIFR